MLQLVQWPQAAAARLHSNVELVAMSVFAVMCSYRRACISVCSCLWDCLSGQGQQLETVSMTQRFIITL